MRRSPDATENPPHAGSADAPLLIGYSRELLPYRTAKRDRRTPAPPEPSPYLMMKPRILRDVCRAMEKDDSGRACPQCCVRDLCEKQVRSASGG
ncbi:MAG TPA: hypothetical protein VHY35_05660 [Stellaceae bacterium]|jgi:hypothetical protein|nr:hypothetical protein [Stellaceae bacterium]